MKFTNEELKLFTYLLAKERNEIEKIRCGYSEFDEDVYEVLVKKSKELFDLKMRIIWHVEEKEGV